MIYQYRCPDCGLELEIEETMAEHGKVCRICIECAGVLESVVTGGSGFKLEGGSWASTGYKSKGVINPEN